MKHKMLKKTVATLCAMTIGFFSAKVTSVKTSAVDNYNFIDPLYWGNYINESISNYWLRLLGEQDIVFRGKYVGQVISGTTEVFTDDNGVTHYPDIYFSPGTSNIYNFNVKFTRSATLTSSGYFATDDSPKRIYAKHNAVTNKFSIPTESSYSVFHLYSM